MTIAWRGDDPSCSVPIDVRYPTAQFKLLGEAVTIVFPLPLSQIWSSSSLGLADNSLLSAQHVPTALLFFCARFAGPSADESRRCIRVEWLGSRMSVKLD